MTPDDELRMHFARALVLYAKHEQNNGRLVPTRELLDFARYLFEGSMRQDATNVGDSRRADQNRTMSDELLTKREAAVMLARSVRSVERLIAAGELPVVRSGRSVRIRRGDVRDLIARHRTTFRDRLDLKEGDAA